MDDAVAEGMRRMGASEEQVQQALAKRGAPKGEGDGAYAVEEDAWESWCFFMEVQRHWVRVGLEGKRDRLDFPAIQSVAQMAGLRRRRMAQLTDDLLLIERTVLAEDARIDSRAGGAGYSAARRR